MARLGAGPGTGHTVLVIDDSEDLRTSVADLLRREGHAVLTAGDGDSGIERTRQAHPSCILLDYFMPGATGEDVVRRVREFDRSAQIILVTGYAGDRPAREMMKRLDIQGYHDKADGPDRLLLWVDSAIKSWESQNLIRRRAAALKMVADAARAIHRIQPVEELLPDALGRMLAIVGASTGAIALENGGVFVTADSPADVILRASAGRYATCRSFEDLPANVRAALRASIEMGARVPVGTDGVALPMRVAERTVGACVIDAARIGDLIEIIESFATHVALALENLRLYEIATTDTITRLYARGHVVQRLLEGLKFSARAGLPVSVLLLDIDHFKRINDTHGHSVGDMVLARIGRVLRRCVRDTDVAGRYGGEEFLIVAPATPAAGAAVLAEKLRAAVEAEIVETHAGALRVTTSVGYGTVTAGVPDAPAAAGDWWTGIARSVIAEVDAALYAAKQSGRNRAVGARSGTSWSPSPAPPLPDSKPTGSTPASG